MSTPIGVIKKFVNALTTTKKRGTAAVDVALKAVGAESYAALKSEIATAKSDASYQDKDFLLQKCGINIDNEDTGAITGSDAGGSTVKSSKYVVPENTTVYSSSGSITTVTTITELTREQYNSFVSDGLSVNVTYKEVSNKVAGKNFNKDSATYLTKQRFVTSALYTWWIPQSLALINQSLGINFTDGRAKLNTLEIVFDNEGTDEPAVEVDLEYKKGYASKATLTINSDLLYKMTAKNFDGTLPKESCVDSDIYDNEVNYTNYLDRLILTALTEVALAANIPYVDELPDAISGGLCVLTGGYDDASTYPISFSEINDTTPLSGYTQLRYLAKNYADGIPDGVTYNADKTALIVSEEFEGKDVLNLANFAGTVKNVNAKAAIVGVKLIANSLNNSILGGAGDDIFIFTAGNDTINDYAAGDKISFAAEITNVSLKGSDVIFTVGENTLTVKNGVEKNLTIINSKGKTYDTVVSDIKTLTITNKTSSPATLASDIRIADATKRTKDITIVGNKLSNTIIGGSKVDKIYGEAGNDSILGGKGNDILFGGSGLDILDGGIGNDKLNGGSGNDKIFGGKGNDTLFGGAGNDSLWGDAGADIFIYSSGDGKDIIFGFDDKDTLTLDCFNFTATYKNDALTLTFDDGSVTLKEFTSKTFHVNDDAYTLSDSKFVKK